MGPWADAVLLNASQRSGSGISGRGLLQATAAHARSSSQTSNLPTESPDRTAQHMECLHAARLLLTSPPPPGALSFHPFPCDALAAQLSLSASCSPCVQERVTAFQHRAVWFALFGAMHISYAQLPSWQRPASPGSCWVLSLSPSLSLFVCLLVVRFLGCRFCWLSFFPFFFFPCFPKLLAHTKAKPRSLTMGVYQ